MKISRIAAALALAGAAFSAHAAQDSGQVWTSAQTPVTDGSFQFFRIYPDDGGLVVHVANSSGGSTSATQGASGSAADAWYVRPGTGANFAQETGGNLASIKTDLDSIAANAITTVTNTGTTATGIGAPADAAYTSGSGSIISILKGIFGNTALGSTAANQSTTNTNLGAPGAVACATDTASCSINQLQQRIAQRISSLITALGSPFQAGGSIGNTTFGSTPDNVSDGASGTATGAAAGDLTGGPTSTVGYAVILLDVASLSATSITPNVSTDAGGNYRAAACRSLTSTTTSDVTSLSTSGVTWECPAGNMFKLTQVGSGASSVRWALKRNSSGRNPSLATSGTTNTSLMQQVGGYDGSVARRFTTDTAGNQKVDLLGNAAATLDAAPGSTAPTNALQSGGAYTTNANQPALTTGQLGAIQLDPAGNVRTAPQRPAAADILAASTSVTSTTGSTALITITAGRTWVGEACASVSGSKAAASTGNGEVLATFLTAGTNVSPAAGTYLEVDAAIGANAATGVVGTNGSNQQCTKFTVAAPAGNTVTLNYSATCTNTTACRVSVSAFGVMQ